MYYTNRLPILFESGGVELCVLGYDATTPMQVNVAHTAPFKLHNVWYAFPLSDLTENVKIHNLSPADIAEEMLSYLESRILALLGAECNKGSNGGLIYRSKATSRQQDANLDLEFDGSKHCFFARITIENLGDLEEFNSIQSIANQLKGKRISPEFRFGSGLEECKPNSLSLPSLIFSPDGTQHHQTARIGLKNFGPYSRERFRNRQFKVLVVSRGKNQASMSSLVKDLVNGISHPQECATVWGQPWAKAFAFKGVDFEQQKVEDFSGMAISTVAERQRVAMGSGRAFDLVLYESDQEEPLLEASLMGLGTPFHWISPVALRTQEVPRAQMLRDLALVLYSKFGGEPWLLPVSPRMEQELVVGLGSTTEGGGVMGFATVFSSQGNYKLGQANWTTYEEESIAALSSFMLTQLEALSKMDGWADRSRLNILFHLDRSITEEATKELREALLEALGPKYDLQVAFIHLEYSHEHRLWDTKRLATKSNGQSHGRFMPAPGTNYFIDREMVLLQICEPSQATLAPNPLLLSRLPNSDDWGLDYITAQAYYFCGLSWRSVERGTLPGTLEYGRLIAEKCRKMRSVDPNVHVHPLLYSIPWYL